MSLNLSYIKQQFIYRRMNNDYYYNTMQKSTKLRKLTDKENTNIFMKTVVHIIK